MDYIKDDVLCLQMEIDYLNTGKMNLLVDPGILCNIKNEIGWKDSMAYLNTDDVSHTKGTQLIMLKRSKKKLIKCGFLVTLCPKKV